MLCQQQRSRRAWLLRRRRWRRDTVEASEGALAAMSAALLVALAVLVLMLVALVVSTMPDRPLVPTPLTAQTLLLGGGFAGGGHVGLSDGLAGGGHVGLGGGIAGGGHVGLGNGFAGGRHDLGDGIALDGRNIGGSHLMYGRVAHWGRGGVFLGYTYPDPGVCYQYPEYYNPAVGCYGLYPIG